MFADDNSNCVMTVPDGVGSAVGLSKIQWYIAIVKNNTEKSVSEKLATLEYNCYVPLQKEQRIRRSGRRVSIERVVIPTIVFIQCTEIERREIVKLPYILRFMSNRAASSLAGGSKPLATIPDSQIKKLMFMVGNSDTPVTISTTPYKKGDYIRIVRGRLAGLEGEVKEVDNKQSEVIIGLDILGYAKLTIDSINIERIKHP